MRLLSKLLLGLTLTAPLQGNWEHSFPLYAPEKCHGSDHTDLIPILRLGMVPRFFADTAAMPILGEVGMGQNRINASFAFPLFCKSQFKFGGEMLNQNLSYHFPYDHAKAWSRQYAVGGVYRLELCLWGLKSLDIGGQWTTAQNHRIHKFHRKKHFCHSSPEYIATYGQRFERYIAGSKAYAFSAGLTIEPWFWATLGAAGVYDKVEYNRKYLCDKVVSGWGGNVFFEQRFTPEIALKFRGEFRRPYIYYEGSLAWRTTLASTDVIIGVYGGHTQGRYSLPSSTVAGIEIGFDFGVSSYSFSRSVGLCSDYIDPCKEPTLGCQDYQYLQWMATPAVYVPEVLAIAEQYRLCKKYKH